MFSFSDRRAILMSWTVGLLVLCHAVSVHAQGRARIKTDQPDPAAVEKTMAEYEKNSQRRTIENRDGVYLELTYWRAKQPGRTTPVVLLLPMKGRTQRDWYPFAHSLYEDGFAVVTFDFRGHGGSTYINPERYRSPEDLAKEEEIRRMQRETGRRVVIPGSGKIPEPKQPRGDTITYKDDFRTDKELGEMMVRDLEDVKRFLLELNNGGEINILQLGIVAAEMSCNVVLNWLKDYEFQSGGKTGWTRQGGDVGALVLITPTVNYGGYKAELDLGKAAADLPILLVANSSRTSQREAASIARKLKLPELKTKDRSRRASYFRPDSGWLSVNSGADSDKGLEGTLLFKPPVDKIDATVHGYLAGRLKDQRGRIWKERRLDVDLGFGSGRVTN